MRTLTCENELVYGYVIDEFRDMQKGRNFAPFSLLFGGEGDSNPRYAFTYARFPSVCLKPLNHLSNLAAKVF